MEMEFKDLVRIQRKNIGKTLEEVANIVGVTKATVQRWESGEIKDIRRDKLVKLAHALETTPDYLMNWPMDRKSQVEIARHIKECRLKQDISQQDLARALGYKDQSMISKIESGSIDLSTTKLSKIADFFDMPIEYFLGIRETEWHSSVIEDYHNARTFKEKKQIVDSSDGVDPSVAYDFYVALHDSELDKQLEGVDFALYGEVKDLTEAQKRDVLRFIQFLKQGNH